MLFRRLAVFCSPFTLTAAETVGAGTQVERAQVLDLLAALIAQSLVTVVEAGPELRYRMLVTVRDYAARKLAAAGELDEVRRAHLDYVLAAVADVPARPGQSGVGLSSDLMRRFETFPDDIRAAFEHALASGDRVSALGLAARFGRYAWVRSRWTEGLAWAERALGDGPAEPAELYGCALYSAAAHALFVDHDRSERHAKDLVSLGQRTGDHDLAGAAWFILGNAAIQRHEVGQARLRYQEMLRLADQPLRIAMAERSLAYVELVQGDVPAYRSWCQRAIADFRALGDEFELARTLAAAGGNLADLAGPQAYPEAAELLSEGLGLGLARDYASCVALALVGLARLAEGQGRPADALAVVEAARAHSERAGSTLEQFMRDYAAADREAEFEARLASQLSDAERHEASLRGRSLTPRQGERLALPPRLPGTDATW